MIKLKLLCIVILSGLYSKDIIAQIDNAARKHVEIFLHIKDTVSRGNGVFKDTTYYINSLGQIHSDNEYIYVYQFGLYISETGSFIMIVRRENDVDSVKILGNKDKVMDQLLFLDNFFYTNKGFTEKMIIQCYECLIEDYRLYKQFGTYR